VAGGEGGAERLGLRLGRGIGEACGRRGVEEERMSTEGDGGTGVARGDPGGRGISEGVENRASVGAPRGRIPVGAGSRGLASQ
jgi:hypothetical protein